MNDNQSYGGRAGAITASGPPANPFFNHTSGGDSLAREKEEIDLRGKMLKEQVEKRGMDSTNQLRIGGNYLNVNDPNKPEYTPFYLMATGHI